MDESKITDKVAISQYKELNETTKSFATVMLQIAVLTVATLQRLYQIKCIDEEKTAPDNQEVMK